MPVLADNHAKSDYYFMEAMRRRSLNNDADAEALLRRAYDLNPDPAGQAAKFIGFAKVIGAGADSLAFASGLKMIEDYVRLNPDDTYAGVSLGDFYARGGLFERALPLYSYADSMNPGQPSLALRHARALEMLKRTDEAVSVYRRIETREGRNPSLTFYISNLLINQSKDTVAAMAEVESLLAAKPGDTEVLALAISANNAIKRPDEAMRLIHKAIALEPDNIALVQYCIEQAADVKGIGDAFEIYEQAMRSDDFGEEEKSDLLNFFFKTLPNDDETLSTEYFKKACDVYDEENPDGIISLIMQAAVAYTARDFDSAADFYGKALKKEPDSGFMTAEMMRMYILSDRNDDAIAKGLEALKNPAMTEKPAIREMLGGAYMNKKEYQKAAQTLRQILDSADDEYSLTDEDRSHYIASIADAEQNYLPMEEAAKSYEEAIKLDPTNILAKNNYAYMLSEKGGDLSRAEELINEVLAVQAHNPVYLDTAAWIAYQQGKYGPAIGYIEEALVMLRDTPATEYLLHAGDIYYRAGMTEKALEQWQKGLEQEPDSADLKLRVEQKRIPE